MELNYQKGSSHVVCLICFKLLQSRRNSAPGPSLEGKNIHSLAGRRQSEPLSTLKHAHHLLVRSEECDSTDSELDPCIYQDFDVAESGNVPAKEAEGAELAKNDEATYEDIPKHKKELDENIYLDITADVPTVCDFRWLIAIHGFVGVEEGEVSVEKHERLEEVMSDQGDGWTKVRTKQGLLGFVPTSYVKETQSHGEFNSKFSRSSRHSKTRKASRRKSRNDGVGDEKESGTKDSVAKENNQLKEIREEYLPTSTDVDCKTVVYRFIGTDPDDLSVEAGDVVKVVMEDTAGNGWTKVRAENEREGFVPSSYIR